MKRHKQATTNSLQLPVKTVIRAHFISKMGKGNHPFYAWSAENKWGIVSDYDWDTAVALTSGKKRSRTKGATTEAEAQAIGDEWLRIGWVKSKARGKVSFSSTTTTATTSTARRKLAREISKESETEFNLLKTAAEIQETAVQENSKEATEPHSHSNSEDEGWEEVSSPHSRNCKICKQKVPTPQWQEHIQSDEHLAIHATTSTKVPGSTKDQTPTKAVSTTEKERIQLALEEMKKKSLPNRGKGDCLWRVVAMHVYGTEEMHNQCRTEVTSHMNANVEQYENFVLAEEGETVRDAALQYIEDMSQQGTWAGQLEIRATLSFYPQIDKVTLYRPTKIDQNFRLIADSEYEPRKEIQNHKWLEMVRLWENHYEYVYTVGQTPPPILTHEEVVQSRCPTAPLKSGDPAEGAASTPRPKEVETETMRRIPTEAEVPSAQPEGAELVEIMQEVEQTQRELVADNTIYGTNAHGVVYQITTQFLSKVRLATLHFSKLQHTSSTLTKLIDTTHICQHSVSSQLLCRHSTFHKLFVSITTFNKTFVVCRTLNIHFVA